MCKYVILNAVKDLNGVIRFFASLRMTLLGCGAEVRFGMRNFYVYIMASISRTLYTGVTNDLVRRVYEHKHGLVPGFTSKYNITRLVYFEETSDVEAAIAREKQIKGWLRAKKVSLVETINPRWNDLSEEWYGD